MSFKFLIACAAMLSPTVCGLTVSAQTNATAEGTALTKCSVRQVSSVPAADALASDGNRVYVGTVNGTLTALDAATLEIAWRAELGGEFASDILPTEVGIAAATNPAAAAGTSETSTLIRMLSKESGITIWSLKLAYSGGYYLGMINGSIAAVSRDGMLTLADRATGRIRWQGGPFGKLSAKPSFSAEAVVLGTADKQLIVISAQNGAVLSRQSSEYVPTAVSFSKSAGFIAGDERGNITLFGAKESKSVWRFKSGAAVSFIAETDEGILVTSLDNFVYFISGYNGDVIWKRRLTGRVIDGGLVTDGYFVVLIYGENSAFVIDLKKGKVTDALPASDKDIVSRVPVLVRNKTFVVTTASSVETYALGGCGTK